MLGGNDSCSVETKTGNREGFSFVWEFIRQFEKRVTEAVDLVLKVKVVRRIFAAKELRQSLMPVRLGIAMRRGLAMSGQQELPFGFDNATDTSTTVNRVLRREEIKS
jgi:hypothetical protein